MSSFKPLAQAYTITPVSCRIRQWFGAGCMTSAKKTMFDNPCCVVVIMVSPACRTSKFLFKSNICRILCPPTVIKIIKTVVANQTVERVRPVEHHRLSQFKISSNGKVRLKNVSGHESESNGDAFFNFVNQTDSKHSNRTISTGRARALILGDLNAQSPAILACKRSKLLFLLLSAYALGCEAMHSKCTLLRRVLRLELKVDRIDGTVHDSTTYA